MATLPAEGEPGVDDERALAELDKTFSVEMNGIEGGKVQVPVTTALLGVDLQTVIDSQVFKDWVEAIDKDEILFVSAVEVQSVDMFGPRVGFIKFKSTAVINIGGDEGAVMVPGIVFMRGGAVGILVILECGGKEYTILTYQARVPVGVHNLPEVPAGMLDGSGNFKGVAADEIAEECDIIISEDELVDLTQLAYDGKWKGMLPSAGGCDEFLRLYVCRRQVEPDVITELEGRLTGLREEGERIKLRIVPLEESWKISPDAKLLSCLALYDRLKHSGALVDSKLDVAPCSVHELARSVSMLSKDSIDEHQEEQPTSDKTAVKLSQLGRGSSSGDHMAQSGDSSGTDTGSTLSASMLRSRDSSSPSDGSLASFSGSVGRRSGRLGSGAGPIDQKSLMKQLNAKVGSLKKQLSAKESRVQELEKAARLDERLIAENERLTSENERLNAENARLLAQIQGGGNATAS